MSHEIYKEKFVSKREPAWHGLGHVVEGDLSAVEAGNLVGVPRVTTEPVKVGDIIAPEYKAIVGVEIVTDAPNAEDRTEDDERPYLTHEERHVYAIVSKGYHEITHEDFLKTWDKATGAPIETLGFLYDGSTLFLSTKLEPFSVKGDEIVPYLLALNPLSGKRAVTVRKTPVRVVCNNTLQASDGCFLTEWRVTHKQNAILQLETFLSTAYKQAAIEYVQVRELFEKLAARTLSDQEALTLVEGVYPSLLPPKESVTYASPEDLKASLALYEVWTRDNGRQEEHRSEALALYYGDGVGSQFQASKGTAWGLYNAVVEYEQYLKARRKADSFLFGAGADRVAKAFELCLHLE